MSNLCLALLVAVVAASAMPIPEAGVMPANAVPFADVERVALNRARREFPDMLPGTVVPYVDENGQTVAYMFHFVVPGKTMDDYEAVADDVLAGRATLGPDTDLTRWTSPYAHVLVSARYDRPPVIRFGYGASEFYAIGRQGLARAQAELGPGVRLSRIYFVYPVTYLEYADDAGRQIVFAQHFERSWSSRTEFERYVAAGIRAIATERGEEGNLVAYHAPAWARELAGEYGSDVAVFVPQVNRAPFYDWSYGCTPTAAAMVMGYIDRTQDFGRLVDWFWMRRDTAEREWDHQVPNVQRECAIAMHTDTISGGTSTNNISSGLRTVAADNGYTWYVLHADGALWNNYCWDTIMMEIDAGHAFVWSATWEIHSLACFGYRTDDQFVYVHNTWWTPAEWWNHAPSSPNWAHVGSPWPTGGDPHKVEMVYPRGDTLYNSTGAGERLFVGDTVVVRWDNGGLPADYVAIDRSTNAGVTWTEMVSSTPDNGEYHWYLDGSYYTCDSVRLRLRQYVGSTLVSGDGSFGSFRIQREAPAPTPLAPPDGLPVWNPPVVLIVDSTNRRIDSIEFKVMLGVDTIWRQVGVAPTCSLPDTLFQRNRIYKWIVRGHNQYGWGNWGAPRTFRIMFSAIAESLAEQARSSSPKTTHHSRRAGGLSLSLPVSAGRMLFVYDAAGKLVAEVPVRAGLAFWDLRDSRGLLAEAGLYFARVDSTGPVRKFVLVE